MKRPKVIILSSIVIVVVVATLAFRIGKALLINNFLPSLIEKIEFHTQRGIDVSSVNYIPTKGLRLTGVSIYSDTSRQRRVCDISHVYVKFPLKKLLFGKIFSPTITVSNLSAGNIHVSGIFSFSIKLYEKFEKQEDILNALQNIRFHNFFIKVAPFDIKKLSGSIDINPIFIECTGGRFILNNEPCSFELRIVKPAGKLFSIFNIASFGIKLSSYINKTDSGGYEIPKAEGVLLNSPFTFSGKFQGLTNPNVTLRGKADIDIKDFVFFARGKKKEILELLDPEGVLNSSFDFKGMLRSPFTWEVDIKSKSKSLKAADFECEDFYIDAHIRSKVVNIPTLSASLYNGSLASSMQIDLIDYQYMPYKINCALDNIDIGALLKNTALGNKNIKGCLFSKFSIRGDAKNIGSANGSGNISITDANLGPMPLLTPLVGNLYGYFQNIFAGLKRINITKGSCNFSIANKKIMTENLALWGELVSIHATGYMDFAKNLNFYVENRFAEPEKIDQGDWQTTLQEMIVNFGKLMSSAHLTGTLQKPKWKFEYMSGVQNIIKGELGRVLKDIFE